MRLCIVSAKYPFGLGEAFLDTELRALAPKFEHVTVFPTSPRSRTYGYDEVPADVVALPLAGARTFALAVRALVRRPRAVLDALVTLLREPYAPLVKLKNLAVVPKGLALSEVALARRLDHVHAYWLSTPATVGWLAARVAGIPFSATTHRWDLYENNMAAAKLRDAAFVRTISERGRTDLLAIGGGDPARVAMVRLGVDLPALGATPPPGGPLRILCAARLVPVKGHATLLEALALLRAQGVAFDCTLAGDGELRGAIGEAIEAAGLGGCVHLAGAVPHDQLLAQLQAGAYDVSVMASVEEPGGLMEGVPVALIEAMAAGTVVVATDSGSVRELVDAATGMLVRPSDPPALAAALGRVAGDPALRARLREGARRRVEDHFDGRQTSERLVALIRCGAPP